MESFSFVHAADLHIDSPFRGVTAEAPLIADALYSSTFRAFEALIRTCIEREADFLLIAGDVYDGQDRSLRAQLRFRDGLARLAEKGIHSYVVHGNHDPLDGRVSALHWPEQVHTFLRPKVESVLAHSGDKPVAYISGVSFPKRDVRENLAKTFRRQETDLFQIGLLHCNVGTETGHELYAPCELEDLRNVGMNYWALGHVHERRCLSEEPWIIYPGNIQGRSMREQGERGCNFVHVDERGRVQVEFVPLDVVRWSDAQVCIDGLETVDSLENAIVQAVESMVKKANGRSLVCRISVEGRGPLHRDLRVEGSLQPLLERARERFDGGEPFTWLQSLDLNSRSQVDLAVRAKRGDLLAEVLVTAQTYRDQKDGLKGLYENSLADLWNDGRVQKATDPPSEEYVSALLSKAELLCLDLLEVDE